ncbi:MAG: 4-phosphopantetheinyl transferase family protein [Desulfobacterales bacterium]|nr:4-phosphopantetheinyl transferase family protein [Desulfobacterales bacterium]
MNYVGNDIVDLKSPHAIGKSWDDRFVRRVFTDQEQAIIYDSELPDQMVWALWAAKESAYKAISKLNLTTITSAPARYQVNFNSEDLQPVTFGIVVPPFGIDNVYVLIQMTDTYIHCMASTQIIPFIEYLHHGIASLPSGVNPVFGQSSAFESDLVRRLAIQKIAHELNISPGIVSIQNIRDYRGLNIPKIYIEYRPTTIDISFSHDGNYVAYVFYPNANIHSKIRN